MKDLPVAKVGNFFKWRHADFQLYLYEVYRRTASLIKYVEDIILWIRSRLSQRQFILFSADDR